MLRAGVWGGGVGRKEGPGGEQEPWWRDSPLFPVLSYFPCVFWNVPLHGNRRVGDGLEAGQDRVHTRLGLVLLVGGSVTSWTD